jgi:TonB-linked SusC/RagA family outer membrane protein
MKKRVRLFHLSRAENAVTIMRRMSFLLIFSASLLAAGSYVPAAAAPKIKPVQQAKDTLITGTVTDQSDDAPLPGVSVKIPNSSIGVTTNEKGKYALRVPRNVTGLVFSSIGYKTQHIIVVNGQVRMNVAMEPDVAAINEVQVVAYGVQKKESVVGAISTVKVKDLKTAAPRSLVNALAGKVAGVISVQRSGEPGKDDAQFWIRGISTFGAGSQPLVLVDGVERPLSNVEPEDIESFSVLKDASATSVYGIRGANGVILVTTRRGTVAKPVINFKYEKGIQSATSKPKYVDAPTYLELLNEANLATNPNYVTPYTPEVINKYRSGEDPALYPNVDWMKLMMKDYANSQRATLNVSGGTEKARYYIGGSYYDESGAWSTDALTKYDSQTKLKRFNFRSNTDIDLRKDLQLSLGLGGFLTLSNYPGDGNTDAVWYYMGLATPAKYQPSLPDPVYPGKKIYLNSGGGGNINPLQYLEDRGYTNAWNNTLQTDISLKYDAAAITKGLKGGIKFAYDAYSNNQIQRTKGGDQWTIIPPGRNAAGELTLQKIYSGTTNLGYTKSAGGNRRIYFQGDLSYDRQFGQHKIGALLLYNQQDYQNGDASSAIDAIPFRFQGLVSRVTYNYRSKYYAEINGGYNGSENFAAGHRFGLFPSFAVGWLASEEPFFKDRIAQKWISYLKFRGSYGIKGNDQIGGRRFAYLTTVGGGYGAYPLGYNVDTNWGSVGEDQWGSDLTWEKEREKNIGVEIRFLNGFYLQVDYFTRHRTGIFQQRNSLPAIMGLKNNPWGNIGEFKNAGMEATLEYNRQIGDVSLSLRGNYTFARNNLVNNDAPDELYTYQNAKGKRLGQPFGLLAEGLFTSTDDIKSSPEQTFGAVRPGDIRYKDVNGDGVINTYDRVAIGNPNTPEMVYGFGTSVSWKGFDISVFFQGAGNMDFMLGGDGFFPYRRGEEQGNVTWYATDRWTPDNQHQQALFPRLSAGDNPNNYQTSTWWQRKANYLRLKTAELGYTLPKSVLHRLKINTCRIYVSGLNLYTFSSFKFWDPELGSANGGAYPIQRIINGGININF